MRDHRIIFLLICLTAAFSVFGQITNIDFIQPGDSATMSCQDLSIQIIIESDSPIDPSSISMEVRDTIYNYDPADTMFTWTPGSDMLEWIVPGDDLWEDGIIDITLFPVVDDSGDSSETMNWTFMVDRTEPYVLSASPDGVTIEELSFDIEVNLEDPLAGGVNSGIDISSVTVQIEETVLDWNDPAIEWDGTNFTISSDDLTTMSFEDNQEINVIVEACDDIQEALCGPNCMEHQFSFTLGATPCYQEPNPITPNGDGKNDYVEFRFPDMRTAANERAIHIFDINGGKVVEMIEPNMGSMWTWDGIDDEGNPCGQGTYAYVIVVDDELVCDGTITILR
ncbi:MAG: gliding motility-associated C-terminal domain-containing protein [Candidatus Zixiibacteriota bacterium]